MAQETDKQRDKRDRIERLRRRLDGMARVPTDAATAMLRGVVKGILDLLDDEL